MAYGITAVFDQTPSSNDYVLDPLVSACGRPLALTPDRPSSTRWPPRRFSSSPI